MYTDFYKLKEKPFTLTPSSRFLYLGEVHKEALALLTYGVAENKGFTLLTGEVGTGKTTMIHALLAKLGKRIQYVHLSNPLLSANEFLNFLASSVFSDKTVFKSKTEFLIELENFLKTCLQHQKSFILIIDEAHKLSFEILEEVRLLSNMETADEKLINIFLAGQPELNEKLSQPQCRALLQRINTRYHIDPLDLRSTHEYILKRLEMAGASKENKIFSKTVIDAIHQYSKGYPRMINILADNVLLLGYARNTRKILPGHVKECYEDLQLDGSFPKSSDSQPEVLKIKQQKDLKTSKNWKWATPLLLIFAIFTIAISWYGSPKFKKPYNTIAKKRLLAKIHIEKQIQENVELFTKSTERQKMNTVKPLINKHGKHKLVLLNNSENIKFQEHKRDEDLREKIITVKEGETLMALALEVYGQANEDILKLLQKHNPEIKDTNYISVNQKIIFPELLTINHEPTFTVHIASYKPFESARELFLNLLEQGREAYIIPVYKARKGKFFRISLGNFKSLQEAENYAEDILKNNISDYARVIQLEMN